MFKLGSVLIVDDNPLNVTLARDTLEEAGYEVMDAPNASEGMNVIKTLRPDVTIMDIMMPGIAGDEATRILKSDPETSSTRIIIVSAKATPSDVVSGFQCRADDYLTKPYYPQVLLARVKTQMIVRQAQIILTNQKVKLEDEMTEQFAQLHKASESIFLSLAKAAEFRNRRAGSHMEMVGKYTEILVKELKGSSQHAATITNDYAKRISWAAQLHDIGKTGIPDHLLENHSLNDMEREEMKRHTSIGGDIFKEAIMRMSFEVPMQFNMCADIARYHHERFNGSGYPEGLSGTSIPLSARLVALADTYDGECSSHEDSGYDPDKIHEDIVKGKGTLFDPVVVDAYLANSDVFKKVAAEETREESQTKAKIGS